MEAATVERSPRALDSSTHKIAPAAEVFGPTTFHSKVERVAECLASCHLAGGLELDTQHNIVHAYVDAHYIAE